MGVCLKGKERGIVPALLSAFALLMILFGILNYHQSVPFENPIAFIVRDSRLYVLEKESNRLLEFDLLKNRTELLLDSASSIDPDENGRYFMPRVLYRGPDGFVVKSYIYESSTREFLGYRFREYFARTERPRDILSVFFNNPKDYPEMNYACGPDKSHYFANNCSGHRNIWKIPYHESAVVEGTNLPESIEELGDKNSDLSNNEFICVGPDRDIYLCSGEKGRILRYSPQGIFKQTIGDVGFSDRELLAPDSVFFASFDLEKSEELLTVASTGTRTWVQYDNEGNVAGTLNLLHRRYPFPDILVGEIYSGSSKRRLYSFDLANKNFIRLASYLQKDKDKSSFSPFSKLSKIIRGETGQDSGRYYSVKWGPKFIFPALSALILLLAACQWTRLRALFASVRIPFFVKLLMLFIPMLLLSAYLIAAWISEIMLGNLQDECVRRSANLARAVINSISMEDLDKISRPEDRESPEYSRIYSTVNKIVDSENVEQTPKWIIHKIHGSRYYFGVNIWKGAIYEPYIIPESRKIFYDVLKEAKPAWGIIADEQGEWFSYLYPICDKKGTVTNVLELYRPSEAINRAQSAVSDRVAKVVAFTVFVAAFVVFCFSYVFTRPLKRLIEGTEMISAGNFLHRIELNSRDELSDLGRAFNKMVEDIRHYTDDMKKSTAEREKLNSELRLARDIQLGILPSVFPPFKGAENIEIYAEMIPAKSIGGDYYDFFLIDQEHFGVVVADASGKGIPAALFVMMVRTLIRSLSPSEHSPSQVLKGINNILAADNPSLSFVTMFYLVLELKTGKAKFSNAGHLSPILTSGGKTAEVCADVKDCGGMPLGVSPDTDYLEGELTLCKGDTLVMYSDGISEACDGEGRLFGDERLIELVSDNAILPCEEISKAVVKCVHEHQVGVEQFDDITLLFLRFV